MSFIDLVFVFASVVVVVVVVVVVIVIGIVSYIVSSLKSKVIHGQTDNVNY